MLKILRVKDSTWLEQAQLLLKGIKEFSKKEINQFSEDLDYYFDWPKNSYIYIALENSELLGFIASEKGMANDVLNINLICVKEGHRNKGVASALLLRTLKNKIRKFIVETENTSIYKPAISLYKKLGFIKEAIIKDYYGVGKDEIILTKG